jgi:hypothetical protein
MSGGIPPDEALRELLKVHDPALAKQAKSLADVRRLQDLGLAKAKGRGKVLARAKILKSCWENLRNAVKANHIRLRGTLDQSKPPIDIDEAEQEIGELDIWNATLTCAPERVYKDVRCKTAPQSEAGLEPVSSPPAKPARAKRGPAKTKRVQEAIAALWPSDLWPSGPPTQEDLPNQVFAAQVDKWLRDAWQKDVRKRGVTFVTISDKHILRVGGRA